MKIGDHVWTAKITIIDGGNEELVLLEREIISMSAKQIKTKPVAWWRPMHGNATSKASGSVVIHRLDGAGWKPQLNLTRLQALIEVHNRYDAEARHHRSIADGRERDRRYVARELDREHLRLKKEGNGL